MPPPSNISPAHRLDPSTSAGTPALRTDLIRLEDIKKTYTMGEVSVPVLRGVSLTIQRGELIALVGASGSGKSTLMNLLGCLDRPTSGSYWLEGDEISKLTSDQRANLRNRKMGFVFQNFNLLPRTTALKNVMMPLTYADHFISDIEARERAEHLLHMVGLGDRMHHETTQLSGGQQQRVAIARALINKPPVVFADEPTGNLDTHTTEDVLKMFQRLNAEEHITIILVTHDPNVAHHTKRVIRMSDGVILDEGAPQRVFAAEPITPADTIPADNIVA
jgi:ABC-type lipoprotein export system ATPase subunit